MAGGQILAFPIDYDRRPYNTLALPCECVINVKHLVRDVSRVLTLFLASRQAWPKILGGVSMFGGEVPPPLKGPWIKH